MDPFEFKLHVLPDTEIKVGYRYVLGKYCLKVLNEMPRRVGNIRFFECDSRIVKYYRVIAENVECYRIGRKILVTCFEKIVNVDDIYFMGFLWSRRRL